MTNKETKAMKKEFNNKHFSELIEFMEKLDKSDDYIFLQVSSLKPGKGDMELDVLLTGRTDGKETLAFAEVEAVLIMAMRKNGIFRELITNSAKHYERLNVFKMMQKS